jgi:hypothetical protein
LLEGLELSFGARFLGARLFDQRASRLELFFGFGELSLELARATGMNGELGPIASRFGPFEGELLELRAMAVVSGEPGTPSADQRAAGLGDRLTNAAGLRALGYLGQDRLCGLSGFWRRESASGGEEQRSGAQQGND